MPKSVYFEQKTISKDSSPRVVTILTILKNLLLKFQIEKSPLAETHTEKTQGLVGKFLNFINFVIDEEIFNKGDITLPSAEISLDARAFILFEHYRNYVNAIILKEDVEEKNAEEKKLTNEFLVLREFLLRIVAFSLRVVDDDIEHGAKMITLLREFIQELAKEGAFIKKGFFTKKIVPTGIALATNHNDWINLISKMIEAIKVIHLPASSFSKVLSELMRTKETIVRQIIVFSYHKERDKVKKGQLSESWLMSTFIRFEADMINPNRSRNNPAINISDNNNNATSTTSSTLALLSNSQQHSRSWHATQFIPEQMQVLEALKIKAKENKLTNEILGKIRKLYQLLHKTNLLITLTAHIETLIQIGGWVPILTGFINIQNFAEIITLYSRDYDEVRLNDYDLELDKENEGLHELIKYESTFFFNPPQLVHNLSLLTSKEIREQLFSIIEAAVYQIHGLEQQLRITFTSRDKRPFDYPLINEKNIPQGIGFLQANAAPKPRETPLLILNSPDQNYLITPYFPNSGFTSKLIKSSRINLAGQQLACEKFQQLAVQLESHETIFELNLFDNYLYGENTSRSRISRNNQKINSIPALCKILRGNKNLYYLNVGNNWFDTPDIANICKELFITKSIRQLSIGSCSIDNNLFKNEFFINLIGGGFLEELDLSYKAAVYSAPYDAMSLFESLNKNVSTLSSLYVTGLKITKVDEVAKFIETNMRIQFLDLSYTTINDESAILLLDAIVKNTHAKFSLKQINLSGNSISPSGIEKIQTIVNNHNIRAKIIINESIIECKGMKKTSLYYTSKIAIIGAPIKASDSISLVKANIGLFRTDKSPKYLMAARTSLEEAKKTHDKSITASSDKKEQQIQQLQLELLELDINYEEIIRSYKAVPDKINEINILAEKFVQKLAQYVHLDARKCSKYYAKTGILLLLISYLKDTENEKKIADQAAWAAIIEYVNAQPKATQLYLSQEFNKLPEGSRRGIRDSIDAYCKHLRKITTNPNLPNILKIAEAMGIKSATVYALRGLATLKEVEKARYYLDLANEEDPFNELVGTLSSEIDKVSSGVMQASF